MSCCQSLSNYNLSPGLNWSAFELKAKVGLNRVKIYMTISAQVLSVQAKHPLSSFASGGDRRILVSGGGTSRGRM